MPNNNYPSAMFGGGVDFGTMQIRSAIASDLADIVECEDLAFNLRARTTLAKEVSAHGQLASQIDRGDIHVIAAGPAFLGYISFSLRHDHLFVAAVAVHPKYHRTGVGSRLLSFAGATAFRHGLGKVHLFTDGHNAGNLDFYRQRGYVETGRCEEGDFFRVYLSKAIIGHPGKSLASISSKSKLSAA